MIFDDVFTPLYGKFCWNSNKGYGSFLTFEFGEPHLDIVLRNRSKNGVEEKRRFVHVHGDWHLWIYLCDWKIDSHGATIATNSSNTRTIHRAMNRLNGQCLLKVAVNSTGITSFNFELGDILEALPNVGDYGIDSELWLLYEPSGKVFSVRADMKYCHEPGNSKTEKDDWVPLFPIDL